MREQLIKALLAHAQGDIAKHKANIEVYLANPVGIGEHSNIVEANVPILSATHTTRSGFASSDVDLTDTSESFGLPATADLMFALISTEELEALSQIMVKQLKNRYNDPTIHKRFIVGIDRAKMRIYDCEQKAQDDVLDSGTKEEYNEEKVPKKTFAEFKF